MMRDSAFYKDGEVTDTYLSWHRNGVMRDSIKRLNDSITVSVSWFENGAPSQAGFLLGASVMENGSIFITTALLPVLKIISMVNYWRLLILMKAERKTALQQATVQMPFIKMERK